MSQFTIYRLKSGTEIVCRIQTDLGADTPMLLCAPIAARNLLRDVVPRLHLEVEVAGVPSVLLMSQMSAVPKRELGSILGHANHLRDQIVAAVDLLVTGF